MSHFCSPSPSRRRLWCTLTWLLAGTLLTIAFSQAAPAQALSPAPTPGAADPLNFFPDTPLAALSSQNVTPMGHAALDLEPTGWKHAETENFIYHCFHSNVDRAVATEAEFYYRVIAHDLNKDTSHWERKAHIFIFNNPTDWKLFQSRANLDPWTGGIHANNELFIQRDASYKFKGWTLGHETAHLVVNRFYGSNVPLWLNEGYAEYIGRVAYASFYRARGYDAHPKTSFLAPENFIPVAQLADMLTYPTEVTKVMAFYIESEKLVRFLNAADKLKFQQLLDLLAKGSMFENALHNAFGTRFPSPHLLEEEFKVVATQPGVATGLAGAVAHAP